MRWRWWLSMWVLSGLFSPTTATAKRIHLQTSQTTHPDVSWLRRFLRLRGFQLSSHPSALQLKLRPGVSVTLRRGRFARTFRLPASVRSAQIRARMVLMYVTLFERQHQQQTLAVEKTKAPEPTKEKPSTPAPSQAAAPVATPVAARQVARKAPPRKRPIRVRKRRRARLASRARLLRRPRKTRLARRPKPRRVREVLRARPVPVPKRNVVAIAPPQTPSRTPPRKLPPRLRRPKPRRVATALIKRIVPPPPARPTRWWGDVLSLDLAVAGGIRWFSTERWVGGLQLQVGFNAWRWTLRAEVGLHWYTLTQQNRDILLLRPSFWGGWRVSLGKIERWLEMCVMLGLTSEVFVTESNKTYTSALQWGGLVGLQLHGRLSKRWSLWLRPSLSVFPANFGVLRKEDSSLTPVQLRVLLGVQLRL